MSVFTTSGTENRMRWDRRAKGFMEVWYVTLNHDTSGAGVWLRYTLTSPSSGHGDPYCELWGFLFDPDDKRTFAAKDRFGIDRLGAPNGRDDGALVRIGDAWLSENHLEGQLERDGRKLEWSLDFEPADRCFQHIPQQLRGRIEKRVSSLCSPNLSVPFMGTVTIDGDELSFDGEHGCQTHRWGAQHSSTWVWAHCSRFEGATDTVFEGLAAQTSLGPIPAPTTTLLYLRHEGQDLVFNELKWALRARSRYEMPTWAFTARNDRWKIAGAARATTDRLTQVRYEDPDGAERYCANSEIADLAIEMYEKSDVGWRHRGSLTSLRNAHLEFGRRQPFEEIPVTL
jgi:Tocopherol cyclase